MKARIFIILFGALSLLACNNSKKEKKDMTSGERDEKTKGSDKDSKGGGTYSITAPKGWTKSDTTYMGQYVTFIKSEREDASDNFIENVNVVTEKVGSMGMDEY